MNYFINFPKSSEFEEILKCYLKKDYQLNIVFKKSQERTQNTPKKAGIFYGNALSNLEYTVVDDLGTSVPKILKELGDIIENNLESEGLFRKSGSCPRQIQVQKSIDKTGQIPANIIFNVFDACCLFKQFFAKLPEPVFPTYLWTTFVKIYRTIQQQHYQKLGGLSATPRETDSTGALNVLTPQSFPSTRSYLATTTTTSNASSFSNSQASQIPAVNDELQEVLWKQTDALLVAFLFLPYQNINILRYTFNLLNRIAGHSDKNKMHADNLATLMTPNFLHDINSLSWKEFIPWIKIIAIFINSADRLGWIPPNLYSRYDELLESVRKERLEKENLEGTTDTNESQQPSTYSTPKNQLFKYEDPLAAGYSADIRGGIPPFFKKGYSNKKNQLREAFITKTAIVGSGKFLPTQSSISNSQKFVPAIFTKQNTEINMSSSLKQAQKSLKNPTMTPLDYRGSNRELMDHDNQEYLLPFYNDDDDGNVALRVFNISKRGGKKHRRSGSLVNGLKQGFKRIGHHGNQFSHHTVKRVSPNMDETKSPSAPHLYGVGLNEESPYCAKANAGLFSSEEDDNPQTRSEGEDYEEDYVETPIRASNDKALNFESPYSCTEISGISPVLTPGCNPNNIRKSMRLKLAKASSLSEEFLAKAFNSNQKKKSENPEGVNQSPGDNESPSKKQRLYRHPRYPNKKIIPKGVTGVRKLFYKLAYMDKATRFPSNAYHGMNIQVEHCLNANHNISSLTSLSKGVNMRDVTFNDERFDTNITHLESEENRHCSRNKITELPPLRPPKTKLRDFSKPNDEGTRSNVKLAKATSISLSAKVKKVPHEESTEKVTFDNCNRVINDSATSFYCPQMSSLAPVRRKERAGKLCRRNHSSNMSKYNLVRSKRNENNSPHTMKSNADSEEEEEINESCNFTALYNYSSRTGFGLGGCLEDDELLCCSNRKSLSCSQLVPFSIADNMTTEGGREIIDGTASLRRNHQQHQYDSDISLYHNTNNNNDDASELNKYLFTSKDKHNGDKKNSIDSILSHDDDVFDTTTYEDMPNHDSVGKSSRGNSCCGTVPPNPKISPISTKNLGVPIKTSPVISPASLAAKQLIKLSIKNSLTTTNNGFHKQQCPDAAAPNPTKCQPSGLILHRGRPNSLKCGLNPYKNKRGGCHQVAPAIASTPPKQDKINCNNVKSHIGRNALKRSCSTTANDSGTHLFKDITEDIFFHRPLPLPFLLPIPDNEEELPKPFGVRNPTVTPATDTKTLQNNQCKRPKLDDKKTPSKKSSISCNDNNQKHVHHPFLANTRRGSQRKNGPEISCNFHPGGNEDDDFNNRFSIRNNPSRSVAEQVEKYNKMIKYNDEVRSRNMTKLTAAKKVTNCCNKSLQPKGGIETVGNLTPAARDLNKHRDNKLMPFSPSLKSISIVTETLKKKRIAQ